MVDEDSILEKAVSFKGKLNPAVYVLLDGNEIVYVGKSTNPYGRIGTHLSDKKFDKFAILNAKDFSVDDNEFVDLYPYFEELLIMKYKPKYNKSIDCLIYVSFDMVKREVGLSKFEFRKLISKYKIKHSMLHDLVYYRRCDIQDALNKEFGNEAQ